MKFSTFLTLLRNNNYKNNMKKLNQYYNQFINKFHEQTEG